MTIKNENKNKITENTFIKGRTSSFEPLTPILGLKEGTVQHMMTVVYFQRIFLSLTHANHTSPSPPYHPRPSSNH